jgi:hypothetical protein
MTGLMRCRTVTVLVIPIVIKIQNLRPGWISGRQMPRHIRFFKFCRTNAHNMLQISKNGILNSVRIYRTWIKDFDS